MTSRIPTEEAVTLVGAAAGGSTEGSRGEPEADRGLEPGATPAHRDVSLANSARTVVGTVLEEAGFVVRPEGSLFVVLHRPADRPASGLLTVCGSLFAEQHTDYRREVRLARTLAAAGVAVVRFHYRGVGNSDAGTASLGAFGQDALDVTLSASRSAGVSRVAFLGVGVGSLIASRALFSHPDAPLLLWKPVVDGRDFIRGFFRARLVAATRSRGPRPVPTAELLTRLTREGEVDVMGFTLASSMYESLNGCHLAQTVPEHPHPILVQSFQGRRAAGLEQVVAEWKRRGCRVDVEPVKLAEDPWFIPTAAEVAAFVLATEEQLMASARDWLIDAWRSDE